LGYTHDDDSLFSARLLGNIWTIYIFMDILRSMD